MTKIEYTDNRNPPQRRKSKQRVKTILKNFPEIRKYFKLLFETAQCVTETIDSE